MFALPRFFPRPFCRRRASLRFVLAVLTALGAGAAVSADLNPLSLTDAVLSAERQAPELQARAAGVTAAEAAVGPAGQLPDPELVVGLQNLPVTGDDAFRTTRDFMTMRTIGVMQQFPRGEKRRLRRERAATDVDRERALLTNEQLVVREGVARAWIAAASAERRLRLLAALQPQADAQLAATTAALTAGRATAAEGIAARSAIGALQDRLDAARAGQDMARADLARWLPDLGNRPLGEPPDWRDLGGDPDALVANIAHHRELLAYDAAERAANVDAALARAEKRPDWSLELAYARRGPQFSNMVSVQFRVPLALFAAHRQDPLIASKQALVARIDAEREAAQRMHGAELHKTLTTWRSAVDRLARYERELLPLSEDRADAALAAYRGGRGDLTASLRALDEAIEQRLAYTDLQSTLGQAWATLYFAFPTERTP
ncbi:outer membrane protein TolC [Tahibacter aquaticus]|uniref:Outer membrane protein TolC n=1 Tax=Tahibacter aquaticus TaxID=520092 RepID=A0A4R6Z244_9GAMM|nr:TolC family protein [Tahibacter aquaticus]TDR45665.1 outer membrane protein TolC [Tahibacter aquaticus]